jgi:hypothetical protein
MWTILAVLLGAIVAPCVRADSVSFTCTLCQVPAPTAPDVTFSGPTLDITWNSQTFDLVLPAGWLDSNSFVWLASNGQFIIFDTTLPGDPSVDVAINTTGPGNLGGLTDSGKLVFTTGTAPMPEPDAGGLMLIGLGLLGLMMVMRNRTTRAQTLAP